MNTSTKGPKLFSPFSSFGSAAIECAVSMAFFLYIFLNFWDIMVDRICTVRHYSAAYQLANIFKTAGLRVRINGARTGTPSIEIIELDDAALEDRQIDPDNGLPKGFLPKYNSLFNNLMQNSGTGAGHAKYDVALGLWYLRICTKVLDHPSCANGTVDIGHAFDAYVAGNSGGSSIAQFYVDPAGSACFGAVGSPTYESAKSQFQSYVAAQIQTILDAKRNPDPPIGTLSLYVPETGAPGFGQLEIYSALKPIMFWMMCSDPPQATRTSQIFTMGVQLLDREVAL